MADSRKVILYIAASLDGFIAKTNDDLSFLSLVEKEGEDYGYAEFMQTVDIIITGRKTFDWVVGQIGKYPDEGKKVYIISRTIKRSDDLFEFFSGNPAELIMNLKAKRGKNIYINGGAQIVDEMLKENLIDEMIISFVPVLLGCGTRLFNENNQEHKLKFISSRNYDKGLLQVHYQVLE